MRKLKWKKLNYKKLLVASWILIIVGTLAYAFYIRATTIENYFTEEGMRPFQLSVNFTDDFGRSANTDEQNKLIDAGVSVDELFDDSDAVLLVTGQDGHMVKEGNIFSKARVEKIFKDETGISGDEIYLFEYATVSTIGGQPVYGARDTYNIMRDGRRYVLFLNFRQMPEGYVYTQEDKYTFLLANVYYGKISVDKGATPHPMERGVYSNTYGDVMDWDIVPANEGQIKRYYDMREETLNKLEIKI